MHQNLQAKIADRLSVDWPTRISAVVGNTCSIKEITKSISGCGNVAFGLDGVADTWLCELVAAINGI